jgi:hypothetical protein
MSGELTAAEAAARTAVDHATSPQFKAEGLAVLAHVLLGQCLKDEALVAAREGMTLLDENGGMEEGEALLRLVYAESLEACGHSTEARTALAVARDRLIARAEKLRNYRDAFLCNVRENARTLELARQWLGFRAPEE